MAVYEVPVVFKGRCSFLVEAAGPEQARVKAARLFNGGAEPADLGGEREEIEEACTPIPMDTPQGLEENAQVAANALGSSGRYPEGDPEACRHGLHRDTCRACLARWFLYSVPEQSFWNSELGWTDGINADEFGTKEALQRDVTREEGEFWLLKADFADRLGK